MTIDPKGYRSFINAHNSWLKAAARKWASLVKWSARIDTWAFGRSVKGKQEEDLKSCIEAITPQALIMEGWVIEGKGREWYSRAPWKAPPFDNLVWWVVRNWWTPWSVNWKWVDQPRETRRAVKNLARHVAENGIEQIWLFSKTIKANADVITRALQQWVKNATQ